MLELRERQISELPVQVCAVSLSSHSNLVMASQNMELSRRRYIFTSEDSESKLVGSKGSWKAITLHLSCSDNVLWVLTAAMVCVRAVLLASP